MRGSHLSVIIGAACLMGGAALAHEPAALDALRGDWHRCVRQHFSGQSLTIEKRAAERAALAACKSHEDAYVAAELAARNARAESGARDGLTTRARAWISSVAAYVVDPVASWLGR